MSTQSKQPEQNFVQSAAPGVRAQLTEIDAAGGDTAAVHIQHRPVMVVTVLGARSGLPRRVPLMRVEHEGQYLAVGSKGGAPENPQWVASIRTHPGDVSVLDGTTETPMTSRELTAEDERDLWWQRAVDAFPPYADYQEKTDRTIPIFLLGPR